MVLTPRINESVSIPVITAGGIADGRGLAAALVLGGDGVMMASRFIATEECLAHENIKRELIGRQEFETTLICKTIELQMRCLKNAIAARVLEIEAGQGTFDDILPYMIGSRSKESWESGDADMAPLAVGQSIGLIKEIKSCREVVEGMVTEAEEILQKAGAL
jgi:nitronate monooxygenase